MSNYKSLNIDGKLIDLSTPIVMGIMNLTPDSFYDGGALTSEKSILNQAQKHLENGAVILDLGGYSSRPGAYDIPVEEELSRVLNPIRVIRSNFPDTVISIDTFRAEVAEKALNEGAAIVNDISGGILDENMFSTVAKLGCPYILMHMKGTPQTMKSLSKYDDILGEMMDYFVYRVNDLKEKGVKDIVIDPGFGFSKTIEQNYFLLKNLDYFNQLNLPLLAGISRKSMIYKKLGISSQEALNGTTALNMAALINGAKILRVHDVKEAVETVKLFNNTFS